MTRLEQLVNRVPAPLRAPVGSLLVSARRLEWCRARPTPDGWTHRYHAGVTVQPLLGGPSARLQDQQTRDVFLYAYDRPPATWSSTSVPASAARCACCPGSSGPPGGW